MPVHGTALDFLSGLRWWSRCQRDLGSLRYIASAPVGEEGVQWGGPNAGILSAFQELRAKNPNLKIGISIGGWSKSGDFSEVAADSTKRAKLVENVLKFIEYTNMDFVDLDWEYPAEKRDPDKVDNQNDEGTPNAKPEDKENYIKLLEDFRTALDKKGKELGKKYELSGIFRGMRESFCSQRLSYTQRK